MISRVDLELNKAAPFVENIEGLVLTKSEIRTGHRNTPLLAYWSLAFEFHRAVVLLIRNGLIGAAFALVRPLLEATIRAHLMISASDEIISSILSDAYRTDFGTIGQEIDDSFGMNGIFQNFLQQSKNALHGYTHMGMHQLGRRFSGTNLVPSYSEQEIVEVIRVTTSAVFMVNNVVTKYFGFEEEWKENTKLFAQWGER